MSMKKYIFIFIILFYSIILKAQNPFYAVFVGDTVVLSVTGANGTMQWQESEDSLTWTDIAGAIYTPYQLITTNSPTGKCFYRVRGECTYTHWYSDTICTKIITNTSQLQIGDFFHGGVVFQKNSEDNGLISSKQDQGGNQIKWGCEGNITGAINNSNGATNSSIILDNCPDRPIAASICDTLVIGGYADWFLPAKDEINNMSLQKDIIGNFQSEYYWSSTEYDADRAWVHSFGVSGGAGGTQYKSTHFPYRIRCIRQYLYNDVLSTTYCNTIVNGFISGVVTSIDVSDSIVCRNDSLFLKVIAGGTSPYTYQWKKDGINIIGFTDSIYSINTASLMDEGIYTCEVSNVCNTVESDSVELKVVDLNVDVGSDMIFCNDTSVQINTIATSNHIFESGGFSYNWNTIFGLNDSTIANPLAQPLSPTTYFITVTDTIGCYAIDSIFLDSKTPVSIENNILSLNKCIGSNITDTIFANGSLPILYQWKKNGIDIIGATDSIYSINAINLSDEGIYTCEVSNVCNTIESDSAELKVIKIEVDVGLHDSICIGDNVELQAVATSNHTQESGPISYNWNPTSSLDNANIVNPIASPNNTTTYTVIATDSLGCSATDSVEIFVQTPYQNQQLCLVTVDPTIGKNKIMWNKTPNVGTESYNIYKEVITNVYNWVGNVSYDSASYIIDYGSDPMSHGDKYKITSIDTCGNESELDSCMFHKTINLVIYSYGTTMGLNWDSYEVEDNSFYPLQYYIYRGTTPYNLQIIDSLSGSFNTYNDNNVTSLYYYMVGAVRDDCNSGNKSVYQTLSNKKDNSDYITNLEYESKGYVPLSIYPNPSNKQISIYNGNSNDFENYNLIITDVSGRVIKKENIKNHELIVDITNLSKGTYFIELIGKNIFRGKFIKI